MGIGAEKEAAAYGKTYEKEIGVGNMAATMKANLDALSGEIRKVKEQRLPPGMSPQQFAVQKREQLTQLQQQRAKLAQDFLKQVAETKRQVSR